MFCQQRSEILACPSEKLLTIKMANVECCGPPCSTSPHDASKCDLVSLTRSDMETSDADSTKKAKDACEGKNSCEINVWGNSGTDISGIDACWGKYKRATVKYECKGEYVYNFKYP